MAVNPLVINLAAGGTEEVHYSLLHGLFLIGPLKNLIPQPAKQPDLILNTAFVFVVLSVFIFLTVRKLRSIPESTSQNLLELAYEGLNDFFLDIVGEKGKKYIPFFFTFFVYILFLNLLGLIPGFQSPTADLNTTLGFALIAVVAVQLIAIKEIGFVSYVKHFWGEPVWLGPLLFPLHVIGEIAKVVSLSFRLFGNMFGKETVIVVLMGFSPLLLLGKLEVPYIPVHLPMLVFGAFVGLLQAMIFSLLAAIYLAQFIGEHGHEDGHH